MVLGRLVDTLALIPEDLYLLLGTSLGHLVRNHARIKTLWNASTSAPPHFFRPLVRPSSQSQRHAVQKQRTRQAGEH